MIEGSTTLLGPHYMSLEDYPSILLTSATSFLRSNSGQHVKALANTSSPTLPVWGFNKNRSVLTSQDEREEAKNSRLGQGIWRDEVDKGSIMWCLKGLAEGIQQTDNRFDDENQEKLTGCPWNHLILAPVPHRAAKAKRPRARKPY